MLLPDLHDLPINPAGRSSVITGGEAAGVVGHGDVVVKPPSTSAFVALVLGKLARFMVMLGGEVLSPPPCQYTFMVLAKRDICT